MKKWLPGFILMIGLAVAFWVFRFPLFRIHGMKEWPLWLFVFGAIVIAIFGIALHNNTLSVFVVIGYVLGFVIGYLFQFDYGIGLNSMWIIWTCSYMAMMLVGAVVAIVRRNHRKKH